MRDIPRTERSTHRERPNKRVTERHTATHSGVIR